MPFKKNEYEKLLIYILSNCYDKPHVGKTVLTTTLYFIDFNYYEAYGESLTQESYLKTKKGINPTHFTKVTEEMIEKDKIHFRKVPYYHTTLHKYYVTEIPDVKFSNKKTKIINASMRHLITKNATRILRYASKNPPYKNTDFNEEIDYDNVYFRDSRYSIRKKFIKL